MGDDMWSENGEYTSLEANYDPLKHRGITAIRHALMDYVTALGVVGAAGAAGTEAIKGDSSDVTSNVPRQGHAINLYLPVEHVVQAITKGTKMRCTAESDEQCKIVEKATIDAWNTFYPANKRKARGIDDPQTYEWSKTRHALIVDGTVSSDTRMVAISGEESTAFDLQRKETGIAATKIGPTIADRFVELRTSDIKDPHNFVKEVVEVTFGILAKSMRPSQYVLVADHAAQIRLPKGEIPVGAKPPEVASGVYALISLVDNMSESMYQGLDILERRSALHAMPPLESTQRHISSRMEANLEASMKSLTELNEKLNSQAAEHGDILSEPGVVDVEFSLPARSLLGNPNAIKMTTEAIAKHSIGGQVDIHPITGHLVKKDGSCATHMAIVTVAVDCRDKL